MDSDDDSDVDYESVAAVEYDYDYAKQEDSYYSVIGNGVMEELPDYLQVLPFSRLEPAKVQVVVAPSVQMLVSPVASALAVIGVQVAGYDATPKFTPMIREWGVVLATPMVREGKYVTSVQLPVMGAETMQKAHIKSVAVQGSVPLTHAIDQVSGVIAGIRPKLDGYEVMQFVLHYATGEAEAFMWDEVQIVKVDARGPAHYEKEDGLYYVLSGDAAQDLKTAEHPWYTPTRSSLDKFQDREGVMVAYNAMEYRVKASPSHTLSWTPQGVCDSQGVFYRVRDLGPYEADCLIDVELDESSTYTYLRHRPDKARPDSTISVRAIEHMLTLQDLRAVLPYGACEPLEPKWRIPRIAVGQSVPMTVLQYRVESSRNHSMGPMSWLQPVGSFSDTLPSVVKFLGSHELQLTISSVQRALLSCDMYASSGRVFNHRDEREVVVEEIGDLDHSNVYFHGAGAILIIAKSRIKLRTPYAFRLNNHNTNVLRVFIGVCNKGRPPPVSGLMSRYY